MKKKVVKNFTYTGLGFPVELSQVEMVEVDNEWHPKINVRKVSDIVVKKLATQDEKLTGNQVKFIRTYFSMSLREFAKEVVHESHTAVSKWEAFDDTVTNMDPNIEMMLRLYVIEKTSLKTVRQKHAFYKKYQALKKIFTADRHVSRVFLR